MYLRTEPLELENLDLDPENPRLPEYLPREQDTILEYLALSSSITEIMSAIGSSGYFASEPLIGVPSGDRYVIVEGNRRLTALKLLSGANFEEMPEKIIHTRNEAVHMPNSVPVAIYESVADVLSYLGNKHIAGVKPWGPLAKARYVKRLFEEIDDPTADFNKKITIVTRKIGSRKDFIQKSLKALKAYEYTAERGFFNLNDVDESTVKFSLLSTALDYDGIQSYVYETVPGEDGKTLHYVSDAEGVDSAEHVDFQDRIFINDHLKDLFEWMFVKNDERKTRLGESRNLGKLSDIVVDADALRQFKLGTPLEQAWKVTGGLSQEFDSLLIKIQGHLRSGNSLVAEVERTDERYTEAVNIFKQARNLRNSLDEPEDD